MHTVGGAWNHAGVSLAPYRHVLALPSVARLLLFAVVARIPQTAAGVVLTLHVVTHLKLGYGPAGVVATATTVGMAAGGPWRGRVIDRHGLRRALLPSLVMSALTWGFAPFLGFAGLTVLAFVGGLMSLPIFTVVRQSLSVLVGPQQRRTAYALDSVGVELSFMVGPAAGVLVATQVSTTAALLAAGGCQVLAGAALMLLDPPTRSAAALPGPAGFAAAAVRPSSGGEGSPGAASGARPGGGLRWYAPGLVAVLGAAAAATVVLAGTDVGIVAVLRAHSALPLTGVVFVAWGLGSIAGGLVYGAAHRPVSPITLLLWLAVLTIPVGLAPTPLLLTLTILPAAALCAPVISATADGVSRLVAEEFRGEALGWHGSALTIGSALGAPLAGATIDASAPWAGFAVVGGAGVVLAGLGLGLQLRRRAVAAAVSAV